MAILTFPSITPDSISFGLEHNVQISTSTLSGVIQSVELPGARWKASLNFTNLSGSDSNNLKAFLLSLRGMSGRFYLHDYGKPNPALAVTGSPTVLATTTSRVINCTTEDQIFSVGDYIQIGNSTDRELKMITSVAAGTGGFNRNYTIEPALRMTVTTALTKPIVYYQSSGIFMLTSNDQSFWNTTGKTHLNDINIECTEALA